MFVCAVSFVLVQRACHHEGLDGQSPDTRFRLLSGEDVRQWHFQGVYHVDSMDLTSLYLKCYTIVVITALYYFLVINCDGVKIGEEAEVTVYHWLHKMLLNLSE